MADAHKQDFLSIISCQSVAVLIVLIIRAYCEFPAASLSSDSRGPREQRPQCWRAPQVLVEIIWGWSCDLEHLKYLSIYCGEHYANNTCLYTVLISAPNHKASSGSPSTWRCPNYSTSTCVAPKTPFDVVCHKRVWKRSQMTAFGSVFLLFYLFTVGAVIDFMQRSWYLWHSWCELSAEARDMSYNPISRSTQITVTI